jgi:hypothetical protein
MTDVLDGTTAATSRAGWGHWALAATLVGAAAIHLAMAPSHLGESAIEGAGFLVAAWLGLGLAVLVAVRPRPPVLAATIALNASLIVAWSVSRTAGLPFGTHAGHAEEVSVVDAAAVTLEAIGIVFAALLLAGSATVLVRSSGLALAGGLGVLGLTSAAIASPAARDHAAGSHGDHHAGETAAADDGHGDGHDHGAVAAAGEDDLGFAALSNGHQHAHGTEPLTTDETVALSGQLAATAQLVQQYPTIAAAEAAGWTRAGPFSPGLGTHYMSPRFVLNSDGRMDAEDLQVPMLVFDGLDPAAKLAGFMYLAYGTNSEPEGFAGPNDHWHFHEHVCIDTGPDGKITTPFGADLEGVTEQMCTDVGGNWIDNTGYMVHVWNVPGYESPDGVFTELNRRITCPDGTYQRVDLADLGDRDTTCRSAAS